jgi:uroporphyrinogen-III decarboxylase
VPTTSSLAEREQLIAAAINVERPDRIPIVYQGEAFSPRYMGVSIADYANKPEVAVETTLAALDRLGGFDAQNALPGGLIGPMMASLWITRMLVPGRELPDDVVWQADEDEDMKVEDYDRVLEEGWPAVLDSLLPRVLDTDELNSSLSWLEANFADTVAEFRAHGYVPMTGGAVASPFEQLCGARSIQHFYIDLYRRPEIVKKSMRKMLPDIVAGMVDSAQACALPCLWIGGWRSGSGMLSESTWMEFVLPDLKVMAGALVDAGFTPILHFDHDWTRDLVHLRELPARKCILQLDGMTDIRRAKEVLGDHMCLMGDVPPTLLATGTPEDVRIYVRDLIRDVGDRGFLLAAGCDAPVNAKPENMEALCAAGLKYGS